MLEKIKKNYFLLISIFFILYFLISLLGGERGFFSYLKKKHYLESLKKEETELISKIEKLEIKNSLLTDNLDLDYIEILIRQKFLFGKNGEKIYLIKKNEN